MIRLTHRRQAPGRGPAHPHQVPGEDPGASNLNIPRARWAPTIHLRPLSARARETDRFSPRASSPASRRSSWREPRRVTSPTSTRRSECAAATNRDRRPDAQRVAARGRTHGVSSRRTSARPSGSGVTSFARRAAWSDRSVRSPSSRRSPAWRDPRARAARHSPRSASEGRGPGGRGSAEGGADRDRYVEQGPEQSGLERRHGRG